MNAGGVGRRGQVQMFNVGRVSTHASRDGAKAEGGRLPIVSPRTRDVLGWRIHVLAVRQRSPARVTPSVNPPPAEYVNERQTQREWSLMLEPNDFNFLLQ